MEKINYSVGNIINMGNDLFVQVTGRDNKNTFPGVVIKDRNLRPTYVIGYKSKSWGKGYAIAYESSSVDNFSII